MKYNPDCSLSSFLLERVPAATEITVTISSVCVFETLKTRSEPEVLVFRTRPGLCRVCIAEIRFSKSPVSESPTHLTLENRSPNSFTIKWESPSATHTIHRWERSPLLILILVRANKKWMKTFIELPGTNWVSSPPRSPTPTSTRSLGTRPHSTSPSYRTSLGLGRSTQSEWST